MLSPAQLETLSSLIDATQTSNIRVVGDKVFVDDGTETPIPHGIDFLSKLVKLTLATEISEGVYRLTPRARLVLSNPEYLNQLVIALY